MTGQAVSPGCPWGEHAGEPPRLDVRREPAHRAQLLRHELLGPERSSPGPDLLEGLVRELLVDACLRSSCARAGGRARSDCFERTSIWA